MCRHHHKIKMKTLAENSNLVKIVFIFITFTIYIINKIILKLLSNELLLAILLFNRINEIHSAEYISNIYNQKRQLEFSYRLRLFYI